MEHIEKKISELCKDLGESTAFFEETDCEETMREIENLRYAIAVLKEVREEAQRGRDE